jgi:O-antigen/teichoic acid export membrane protein
VVLFLTIPFFSALLIALPGISILWIGHREPDFLHFGVLLVVAWGINTITGPAYFFNLGTGDLKWNTAAHVLMAILNVVLGAALGKAFGGLGVAMGLAIALAAASVFLVVAFHKRHQVPFEELLPAEHLWLVALVTSYPILFFIAGASGNNPADQILADAIGLALYSVLVGGVIWFHPYRKSLLKRRLFR